MRYINRFKPQLGSLTDSLLDASHGTNFAGQPDFAGQGNAVRNCHVDVRRERCGNYSQVERRVVDAQPSGNVQEYVFLSNLKADALFEHRQQHIHPLGVEARHRALRRAVGCRADKRLCFNQERSCAVDCHADCCARNRLFFVGQKQFRRIRHLAKTNLRHLVDAQFGSAAETVLYRAQKPVHIVAVAFELQHGVDDVLEHFRSRQRAFFINMSDKNDGHAAFFGILEQLRRTFAHLPNTARRRFKRLRRYGLY